MIISTNSDIHSQSSEDGSGLYSPIFGTQFFQLHGDIHYYQEQLDIQHAAGILASQFDYTNIHPHLHLLETPLDLQFPLPQRNHIQVVLDIPPHTYPSTCLPPSPAHRGAINLSYQLEGPDNRRYSAEDFRPQSYSSGGSAQPSAIQTPESTRSSVPMSEPTPQPQPTASAPQDPLRREISNQVMACRQCLLPFRPSGNALRNDDSELPREACGLPDVPALWPVPVNTTISLHPPITLNTSSAPAPSTCSLAMPPPPPIFSEQRITRHD
ncbi:uncharacterized protein HD556DRAFT_1449001 [Suillus plorans]|uniref:Uncharacterized protein n=1 Tax=Suillus plorans TaxID=116603 RepID=A0A9P7AFG7_9AGAM|nr:uncharacterized protein HD556DRAFT_1449001 [Suillus plorans]KAG1787206.1 hypothetical protein HD556DRAFT_1449001 [Suillus plorans]